MSNQFGNFFAIIYIVSYGNCSTVVPPYHDAVAEWLERLGYAAESRRKVVSSRLGFAMRRLKTLSVNPAVNWHLFSN